MPTPEAQGGGGGPLPYPLSSPAPRQKRGEGRQNKAEIRKKQDPSLHAAGNLGYQKTQEKRERGACVISCYCYSCAHCPTEGSGRCSPARRPRPREGPRAPPGPGGWRRPGPALTFVVYPQVVLGEADVTEFVLRAPGAGQRRLLLVHGRVEPLQPPL